MLKRYLAALLILLSYLYSWAIDWLLNLNYWLLFDCLSIAYRLPFVWSFCRLAIVVAVSPRVENAAAVKLQNGDDRIMPVRFASAVPSNKQCLIGIHGMCNIIDLFNTNSVQ